MPDPGTIQEYSIGNYKPHSLAQGNARYLWVTTESKAIIRVNPNAGNSQMVVNHSMIPQLSAGIIKDPDGLQRVWFAAPAPPAQEDPIVIMETTGMNPVQFFPLEADAKAESISLRTTNVGQPGTPIPEYSLVFAEPQHSYVGILTPSHGTIDRMPVSQSTWLWDVAVTTDSTGKIHTYWATGQTRTTNPVRSENGLYRRSPGAMAWESIGVLRPGQKPYYVIADTTAVWLTATNPNQVIRFDLGTGTTRTADLGTAVPQQLAFSATGELWVAASDGLWQFDSRLHGNGTREPLPQGGGAKGLCVAADGKLWYTNPTRKTIGSYTVPPPPFGAPSLLGRTQVVAQGESEVHMKDEVAQPLVVEYVANGRPVPGIPLTCRIDAEGAAFVDGTHERVILTDQRGRVYLPAVIAGDVQEEAVISVGLGNTEPHTATTLTVTSD
ncbi:hypothetical protein [Streptomyces hesseae]|uniref:Uncharacterized protein n=1 Tax=Streptomyces hesseae TaxID=3075519 RepID=A0ABU2SNV7_9ACTN|nr:hypothetical protein [Streptomyces sp. DSM 40473]MDT0449594.1 hypothetical protein [Streptomyces sp. DSM 40473]